MFGAKGFKGARELESALELTIRKLDQMASNAMNNPQPPKPTPEEQNAQNDRLKIQGQLAIQDKKVQGDIAVRLLEHHTDTALATAKLAQDGQQQGQQGQCCMGIQGVRRHFQR